jgi:hypothetical protein
MGGPTSSISYRQHSSWDHVTTQAPPLRQSRDTFAIFHIIEINFQLQGFKLLEILNYVHGMSSIASGSKSINI